jgi:hypothetical protein
MTRLALLIPLLLAAACATPNAFVGRSEADMRSQLGPPAGEDPNSDGTRTLAYPQGRLGTETYMVEVAAGGSVRSVRQALTDDTIMRIERGLTRDQVLRMIGPPREVMEFPRMAETSWEYYFIDTWGYRSHLYVNFNPAGIVVSRFTRRVDTGRDGRGAN